MKLLRLEIQGFKSFKDKTTIHFDEGITGIVGPNGCGKSNIVDALFWVMGAQSAKHLRGSNMVDLIFAGSSKYSPAAWAEVTLVLLNDGGKHIHIGNQVAKPQEIALTRKLYRNGETEYRINGIPARLKDIQEVFMDTGAGAKSYSIIAQGEINRLVQAKPEERRAMIEEVAGITKFKLRKRESMKKIEHTESNLARLEDLQSEIYKHLKSLENQAEKAEKAKHLKEKIKRHELIATSHREFECLSDYTSAREQLDNKAIQYDEFVIRKNQLELNLEDERIRKDDLMSKLDVLQAEYNDQSRALAASEERLKHLKKSQIDKENYAKLKEKENTELEQDIDRREEKAKELNQKLTELENANFDEIDFSNLEEKVENLKDALTLKEEEISELTNRLDDAKVEFQNVDQKLFRNNSKMEEYARGLEDTTLEIEAIEKSTANYSEELVGQRDKMNEYKDKLQKLATDKDETKKTLDAKAQQLKETDQSLRELSKNVIMLESRKQALIEQNKSGAGVKEGALKFLQDEKSTGFELLGNIIECPNEFAPAIEAIFESTFDSLISGKTKYDNLIDWCNDNQAMSFDYLISDENMSMIGPETMQRLELKGLSNIKAMDEIIKINNDDFTPVLNSFFNGFYIVENMTTEMALKITPDVRFKGIVSLDGSVILTRASNGLKLSVRNLKEQSLGIVQRNNLITELSSVLEEKQAELAMLENQEVTLDNEVTALRSSYEQLVRDYDSVNHSFIAVKSSLESKESVHGATFSRLDILKKRKSEISRARLEIIEADEELQNLKDVLSQKLEDFMDHLSTAKDAASELRSSFESERSELLALQANAKTFTNQLDNLRSQIDDTQDEIFRSKLKKQNNQNALEVYYQELEEIEKNIIALEESNHALVEVLSERNDYLSLLKDELSALLMGMQARESEVKELTSKINRIERDNVELNLKIEQLVIEEELLVKDCFERYRVNLRDAVARFLNLFEDKLEGLKDVSGMLQMEGEDGPMTLTPELYHFDKKFPGEVRESKEKLKQYKQDLNRLGEINWKAIEDYDRQKLRYDFLKEQEIELKKSLTDLQTAINHIDEKSKARFKEAYEEVNDRFTKVFPIIFGGGEARLEIVGDLDSPECGIEIVAKPPGKKMQSINLMSGGEKAMTAVSLIFSIFLVKPSPFCLLDEVDAPLDDANVGRFNELLREMSGESQFILITHNKKTMELNDTLYGVTMQEPGVSKAVSVQLH